MEELTRIDDNAVVFKREGTYQARIRVDSKYVYRSLTHKFEFSAELGVPIQSKLFASVIDEYVTYRETENLQGRTSDGMLRQIKRVVRFWRAYAGKKLITEPPRVFRRPFRLSHAAMAGSSSMA